MADSSSGDKTEKASAQKLKKSRQEGQVVRRATCRRRWAS